MFLHADAWNMSAISTFLPEELTAFKVEMTSKAAFAAPLYVLPALFPQFRMVASPLALFVLSCPDRRLG